MIQTWALVLDAYRELNAKKLFWITLILSGLVVGAFALVGVSPRGLTLAGTQFDIPGARGLYKVLYSQLIIGWWLTFGAMILALISTSSMLPDLIVSGTIDLYLSRPMSRLRLFLTKFACGLLFVAGQVAVVAVGSVFIVRWRDGEWIPSLLLSVPLVLLVFSYVFAVAVFIGVWSRSAIAAILLSILTWGFFSVTQFSERSLYLWQSATRSALVRAQEKIHDADTDLDHFAKDPLSDPLGIRAAMAKSRLKDATAQLPQLEHDTHLPATLHKISSVLWLVVPKTYETSNLMDRYVLTDEEATQRPEQRAARDEARGRSDREDIDNAAVEVVEEQRHRSVPLILGTSLAVEAVMVSLAAWIFCRRDY
jgi:hypothetical protein